MSTPADNSNRIAVIGLGLLGTALAERLLQCGFSVAVYNRTREKADPLIERGAAWSDRPLAECDRAVICLYRTEHVEEVLEAMADDLRPGQVLVDSTTGDPQQTESLGRRLAEQGVHYLESPIAASSEQTRRGEALAMVAGEREVYDANADVFAAIAPRSFYLGTWGNAARMKLVNNLILGLNRAALAEGLLFAEAEGLDSAAVLEVLKSSNSYSAVMDVKGRKMVERDFSVQARLAQHRKDVEMILAEGQGTGHVWPLSTLHRELLLLAEQSDLGDADNSAVIEAIARASREQDD